MLDPFARKARSTECRMEQENMHSTKSTELHVTRSRVPPRSLNEVSDPASEVTVQKKNTLTVPRTTSTFATEFIRIA